MGNMVVWDAVKRPPPDALKEIKGGRLKGMSDINPQWRYQIMTEQFGQCGVGWGYSIDKLWTEPAPDEQVCAYAQVSVWTDAEAGNPSSDGQVKNHRLSFIPGVGGSMMVVKESGGLHINDEAYKMAVTDALSVALKMLGVGADVYMGLYDGSKYKDAPEPTKHGGKKAEPQEKKVAMITKNQMVELTTIIKDTEYTSANVMAIATREYQKARSADLTKEEANDLIEKLKTGYGLDED